MPLRWSHIARIFTKLDLYPEPADHRRATEVNSTLPSVLVTTTNTGVRC